MRYFAVIRERGPAWDSARPMRQQERWNDHATFMDALADEGFIVLGGPLGEGDNTFLLIFNAPSESAIEARLAQDPWTVMGLLNVRKIDPWEILLGKTN
jgi:uncharacterized protein YciI